MGGARGIGHDRGVLPGGAAHGEHAVLALLARLRRRGPASRRRDVLPNGCAADLGARGEHLAPRAGSSDCRGLGRAPNPHIRQAVPFLEGALADASPGHPKTLQHRTPGWWWKLVAKSTNFGAEALRSRFRLGLV